MAKNISGAEVSIYANGILFGICQSFTVDPQFEQQPVKVLGLLEPDEIITTDYNLSFQFRGLRQSGKGLVALNLVPSLQNQRQVFDFTGRLFEVRRNGSTLHRLQGCKISSLPVTYEHGQIATYDGGGIGIKATEEGEI